MANFNLIGKKNDFAEILSCLKKNKCKEIQQKFIFLNPRSCFTFFYIYIYVQYIFRRQGFPAHHHDSLVFSLSLGEEIK